MGGSFTIKNKTSNVLRGVALKDMSSSTLPVDSVGVSTVDSEVALGSDCVALTE